MRVRVAWWEGDDSATTIAAPRESVRAECFELEAGVSEAPLSRRGAAFAEA